jgi:hypothetical protein
MHYGEEEVRRLSNRFQLIERDNFKGKKYLSNFYG